MENETTNTPSPEGASNQPSGEHVPPAAQIRRDIAEGREVPERWRHLAQSKPVRGDWDHNDDEPAEPGEDVKSQQQERQDGEPAAASPKGGGYTLDVPAEVPKQFVEETQANVEMASQLGHELGIAQDTMQTLVDFAVALGVDDQSGVALENRGECEGVLLARYGEAEGGKIVADARAAVQRLGPKAVEFLNGTGLGNSPAVLMALASYQRGELHLSVEAAQAQLDKLTAKGSAYWNSNAKDHKLVSDRAKLLYMRAKGKSDVDAAPKAAASKIEKASTKSSARHAQLDREIAAIIRHPAWTDRYHKEHATIKAKGEALYSERYKDE
jgi:hypothetical protein